ncbi:HAMP domain-containing sensor histidine kinase [Streptomyces sp. RKAG290]|uniref:sensor histidine kinase n=1 Tax=Streptomyces sp. RKAG290 TaxID=2888348 RepID=UPI0020347508|nr:HAMP domain-containing sensor histidine kinase [Streptomyces sp. RKAG290]MCM2411083.1 HAMP domain-containing histidine kinase [Streptomyces sp. RKAG290]
MRAPRLLPHSLRARLLCTLVVVTAVVLAALDAALYGAMRGYLTDRTDTSLQAVHRRVMTQVRKELPPARGLAASARMLGTSEYYLEIIQPDGVHRDLVPGLRDPADPPPRVPDKPGRAGDGPVTVPAVTPDGPDYRLLTHALPDHRGTLVVAVPMKQVQGTLGRLLLAETAGTAAGLVLLAAAGLWILRRGLRPLESMARDADAIAAGHHDHRVGPADEDSEVGRLGLALNTMLDGQEDAHARLRRFVADASHELRTPVTAVLGYADLHHQGVLGDAGRRERVMAGITHEALRMRRLVDDLLTLARLDSAPGPRRAPVDLAEIVRAAADAARVVAPDHPLELSVPATGPVVSGDGDQLRRLVDNLLANVRAHTPAGTTARVEVTSARSSALVTVTDDGPGIPADVLPRVLDRFYRAAGTHSGGGSGLGLAIVAAVTASHGGTVEVTSPPGSGGTTVQVVLPAGPPD